MALAVLGNERPGRGHDWNYSSLFTGPTLVLTRALCVMREGVWCAACKVRLAQGSRLRRPAGANAQDAARSLEHSKLCAKATTQQVAIMLHFRSLTDRLAQHAARRARSQRCPGASTVGTFPSSAQELRPCVTAVSNQLWFVRASLGMSVIHQAAIVVSTAAQHFTKPRRLLSRQPTRRSDGLH